MARGPATGVDSPPGAYEFFLPELVTMEVLDAQGRRVRSPKAGARLGAGTHVLTWDGRNDAGGAVRAGVYFVRVATCEATVVKRVVEVR